MEESFALLENQNQKIIQLSGSDSIGFNDCNLKV